MRLPVRRRQAGFSVNLTPMIDVVFNLLIFFLVTSHFARSGEVDEVKLPKAGQSVDEAESPHRLVITIPADQTLRVGGRAVVMDEIRLMIAAAKAKPGFAVQLRADETVPYAIVEPLLLECAKQGITKFGFKTME
jgi:biopolymer transport protein ExbD